MIGVSKHTGGGNFKPAPAGTKVLTLVDVVDLGEVETSYGPKEKLKFTYQTEDTFEKDGDTLNYHVMQRYNKSMFKEGAKISTLRAAIEALLRRSVLASDYDSDGKFDVEKLIGMSAMGNIVQTDPKPDGTVYSNISTIMALPTGTPPVKINSSFVRKKYQPESGQQDRNKWAASQQTEDEIPF